MANKLSFIEVPYCFTEKQNLVKKVFKDILRILNKKHDTSKQ